ncbi:hypothetical protein N9K45_00040 [bacterium]|nr:hypothetical protein [bacterium]
MLVGLSTKEERDFLFKIEGELTRFVESDARRFVFPPMNGHFRRLLHITCRRFGVDSSSSSQSLWGLDKGMEVLRLPRSRTPVLHYADLIPANCEPQHCVYSFPTDAPPVSILPAAAAAAAGVASASSRAQLLARTDNGGDDSKAGRRRGRGVFRFGASPGDESGTAAQQSAAELQTLSLVANPGEGGASAGSPSGTRGREAALTVAEQAELAERCIPAAATSTNDASKSVAAVADQCIDADQLQKDGVEEQDEKHAGSIEQSEVDVELCAHDKLWVSDKEGGRSGIGDQPPSVQPSRTSDCADAHSDGDVSRPSVGSVVQIDEAKELQPSKPTQYGRYTAEVRQANAQVWQAKSGVERRTHASLQPNLADDATMMVVSHSTWRLRRPGNGYVTLKAKGTAGISIIFSRSKIQEKRHLEQHWLRDGGCYYEVRLGQRSDGTAAAPMLEQNADACGGSGYIAKHSAGGGMEILTQHATASVRLRTCFLCQNLVGLDLSFRVYCDRFSRQ